MPDGRGWTLGGTPFVRENTMAFPRLDRSRAPHPWRVGGRLLFLTLLLLTPRLAAANTIGWTDWTGHGSDWMVGLLTLADGRAVEVRYEGELDGSRIDGGVSFWIPESTYLSATVDHGPPTADMVILAGGDESRHTLTFTPPLLDPVVAVVSVGRPNVLVEYEFDHPFTLLSSGGDYWSTAEESRLLDGGPNTMGGDTLQGWEGSGTLQFAGVVGEISWTVPLKEHWHGLTVGAAEVGTAQQVGVPEPPAFALCLPVLVGLVALRSRTRRG